MNVFSCLRFPIYKTAMPSLIFGIVFYDLAIQKGLFDLERVNPANRSPFHSMKFELIIAIFNLPFNLFYVHCFSSRAPSLHYLYPLKSTFAVIYLWPKIMLILPALLNRVPFQGVQPGSKIKPLCGHQFADVCACPCNLRNLRI